MVARTRVNHTSGIQFTAFYHPAEPGYRSVWAVRDRWEVTFAHDGYLMRQLERGRAVWGFGLTVSRVSQFIRQYRARIAAEVTEAPWGLG